MSLGPETVFVVTGAAGGITSAIVSGLAAASRGVFYLLDLVQAPAHDDAHIRLYRHDPEALKRELIEDACTQGERPTPVQIEQQMQAIERSEAALQADEGTPWLPGAMATEALAEVASLLAPGYEIVALEHVEMMGAFKFFRMEPRTLYLNAKISPDGDGLRARLVLRSKTVPKREGLPIQIKDHFSASVRLSPTIVVIPNIDFTSPSDGDLPITARSVYKIFFHGPAYQMIERARVDGNSAIGRFAADLPPNTVPADSTSLLAPRLVELCFQLAALWRQEVKGAMAMPIGFDSLVTYRQEPESVGSLFGIVSTTDDGEIFDCQVVDADGVVYVELSGYRTVARPLA